jgi:hypothetical protein
MEKISISSALVASFSLGSYRTDDETVRRPKTIKRLFHRGQ